MLDVYSNFTKPMLDRFSDKLPANLLAFKKEMQDDLGHLDEGTLGEAVVWFRRNRSYRTFPTAAECISRCNEIKDRNVARAATDKLNAERQLEKQEQQEKPFTQTPREREYVQGGLVLLKQLIAAKTEDQRRDINAKIAERKLEFWQGVS